MRWHPLSGLGRFERANLVHAARVAGAATVLIGLVYIGVAGALDAFVARRVLWEVDQRLSERLVDVRHEADPLAVGSIPDDQGTDGAPVFLWWVPPHGAPVTLTADSPALPEIDTSGPLSVGSGGVTYRLESLPLRGGWLVAGQNLAGPSHIEEVLFTGEVVMGPVLLLAIFAGALYIGMQALAPVELARRRLLEFTSDASHELRTPLTVIEAEIELARSAPPGSDGDREALERVGWESRRLKRIVEDLLWLARFDSAPPPPRSEPVELTELAGMCADRFAAVAASRGLVVTRVEEGPTWVDGPPEWLDRLVGTLLDNACRYTPAGGEVRVSVRAPNGKAVLRVEDSGPGIPVEERSRLFDRFRRATDQHGGAGLGLAIADSVVRGTGGRWRVGESELGGALMEVTWRHREPHVRTGQVRPRSKAHSVGV